MSCRPPATPNSGKEKMYNLLIGFAEHTALGSRVVEHTDPVVVQYISPAGALDPTRLLSLPTLVMPEVGDSTSRQVARVGHIDSIQRVGADYRFNFIPNSRFPEVNLDRVVALAPELGIGDWELHRTHWAVKDVDLYRVLLDGDGPLQLAPQVFRFPVDAPREADLVAVMMPFSAGFSRVYEAIQGSVADAGLRCHRADDIWVNHHIMDDIIDLIWRSRVVVADLTAKNPNVFYETGIAHSLGRDVIQIAQSIDDVPFDLRGIRTLTYLSNGEGLGHLRSQLRDRLLTLTSRS